MILESFSVRWSSGIRNVFMRGFLQRYARLRYEHVTLSLVLNESGKGREATAWQHSYQDVLWLMSIVNCRYIPFLSMWRNLWRRVMTSDNIMATIAAWQQRRTRYYISKISPRLKLWCAGVYSGPSVLDIVQKNFSVLFNSVSCRTARRPKIDSNWNWLWCTWPLKDYYDQRQVAFFTENFMFLHLL